MFVYSLGPIDFWQGWMSDQEYRRQLLEYNEFEEAGTRSLAELAQYETLLRTAFALAGSVGWEGDIRQGCGPFVTGIPGTGTGDDGNVIIAWKQDNNGQTFFASPFRLPWLESAENWVEG